MSDLTPERRAELRELAEDADDINGWATEDYYDEDDECSAHLVSTGEARQFRIALGMQEWNAAYIAAAQPAVLLALLAAADERDQLLTVADTLGRVNGEYAMEIHRCREALGVDEDTDPHHAAQALAAAVEHWHLACIGESIRVSELEAELADRGSQCNR